MDKPYRAKDRIMLHLLEVSIETVCLCWGCPSPIVKGSTWSSRDDVPVASEEWIPGQSASTLLHRNCHEMP